MKSQLKSNFIYKIAFFSSIFCLKLIKFIFVFLKFSILRNILFLTPFNCAKNLTGSDSFSEKNEFEKHKIFLGTGFTLMELMIVLAIVAVVSAYAVPAYQDYLSRSRVGEGLTLAAIVKMLVAENAANGTTLSSGYTSTPATRNVDSISIANDTGQITISYQPRVSAAGANTIVLVPSVASATESNALVANTAIAGMLQWECFAAGKATSSLTIPGPTPAAAATLPNRLAPAECRS